MSDSLIEPEAKPEKLDRRVLRTRAQLQDALLGLIVTQGYDPLRIEDITQAANVRRATFYMHYKDKEELLFSALEGLFGDLVAASEGAVSHGSLAGKLELAPYRLVFQHVDEHAALYRTILSSSSGARIAAYIRAYLADTVLTMLLNDGVMKAADSTQLAGTQKSDSALDSIPGVVIANYIAGVEMAMLTWWLDNDRPYPADTIAQMVQRLIVNGVGSLTVEPKDKSED